MPHFSDIADAKSSSTYRTSASYPADMIGEGAQRLRGEGCGCRLRPRAAPSSSRGTMATEDARASSKPTHAAAAYCHRIPSKAQLCCAPDPDTWVGDVPGPSPASGGVTIGWRRATTPTRCQAPDSGPDAKRPGKHPGTSPRECDSTSDANVPRILGRFWGAYSAYTEIAQSHC